ncbi:1-acyl-sn-glycerol-3-phosphate acyltransferase [Cyclobacterium xiamenense]|uniref:1-acyl-sn-glycerol-3-phosphate acyltransferase n=1 Tax=Cyclobacterium xiamenense TaxID=1297121 RepID=UPI0012B9A156|nr:1-acyl-sn-glycerol-3-phosphate acyltransferase [Cyclobacterium xiamenense]
MSKFDSIRPFYDSEVNQALKEVASHPMMKAIMNFTFPDQRDEEWTEQLLKTHSIRDFQINFIYHSVRKVLDISSNGLTTSGFEQLEPNTAYLFISNHRDIILDTSLLNATLFEHGLLMTTSAIGDNLVKKPFLRTLSKLTRNFVVYRGLSNKAMLEYSKLNSEFIREAIFSQNRSVWIAQREGRTKDGMDLTQKGVLKMLSKACESLSLEEYFLKLKIVPVSISYENDPTDVLKMPELLAKAREETYVKQKNEDFRTLMSGIMGQKKRIHISVGKVLDQEINTIFERENSVNKQLQALVEELDRVIVRNYRLWPTNYIALDLLNQTDEHREHYSVEEKEEFQARIRKGVEMENAVAVRNFLSMYANPVIHKEKMHLLAP